MGWQDDWPARYPFCLRRCMAGDHDIHWKLKAFTWVFTISSGGRWSPSLSISGGRMLYRWKHERIRNAIAGGCSCSHCRWFLSRVEKMREADFFCMIIVIVIVAVLLSVNWIAGVQKWNGLISFSWLLRLFSLWWLYRNKARRWKNYLAGWGYQYTSQH